MPFMREVWPKDRALVTSAISEAIAGICVESDGSFSEAVGELQIWLQPIEHSDFLTRRLIEADLPERFPDDVLAFVDLIVGDNAQWLMPTLGECLDKLEGTAPGLSDDPRFIRLRDVYERRRVG